MAAVLSLHWILKLRRDFHDSFSSHRCCLSSLNSLIAQLKACFLVRPQPSTDLSLCWCFIPMRIILAATPRINSSSISFNIHSAYHFRGLINITAIPFFIGGCRMLLDRGVASWWRPDTYPYTPESCYNNNTEFPLFRAKQCSHRNNTCKMSVKLKMESTFRISTAVFAVFFWQWHIFHSFLPAILRIVTEFFLQGPRPWRLWQHGWC